ncbi:MAG: hypothetical protein ACPHJ3_06560 [Rubripirellula sp.]
MNRTTLGHSRQSANDPFNSEGKQAFREQVECEKAHPKAESYDYTMELAGKGGSSARVPTTAKCHVTD